MFVVEFVVHITAERHSQMMYMYFPNVIFAVLLLSLLCLFTTDTNLLLQN